MYSVTVAQYPHWVELDAGAERLIKGFIYTQRQDGSSNGMVKKYSLQLSSDGVHWSDPVVEGELTPTKAAQKVMLPKPTQARYIRFNALSSHNKLDFASGAELGIIAE